MEKTLVILKPCALQRSLIGEVIQRFERKGLQICGIKMMLLNDEILDEHYAHLADKPFFQRIKTAMTKTPVVVCCLKGMDVVNVVRQMTGATNGRNAAPGTIRGDLSVSIQENIIHASDSVENAGIEIVRFFANEEIFDYSFPNPASLYADYEFN